MFQIKHLVVTDLKRLAGPLVFYALLLVVAAVSTWFHCEQGFLGSLRNWSRILTDWLPVVFAVWIGGLVLLTDPMHEATAFWRVRPWSRRSMGWAKALFLLVVVALPLGLASTVEALWFQLDWMSVFAEIIGGMLTVLAMLWLGWLAVLCSAKGSRVFWIVFMLVVAVASSSWWLGSLARFVHHPVGHGVGAFFAPLTDRYGFIPGMATGVVVLSVATLIMVVWSFRMRRRRSAFFVFGALWVAMAIVSPGSLVGTGIVLEPETRLAKPIPRMAVSEVRVKEKTDRGDGRVNVEIKVPETEGCRVYVRRSQVRVLADEMEIGSPFYLHKRNGAERRYLERLLGVSNEEADPKSELWGKWFLSSDLAKKAKSFRLDGTVTFGVVDLEPAVSFPLSEGGTFRDQGFVCRVNLREVQPDDPNFTIGNVRVMGASAVDPEDLNDSRPLGHVVVFECHRPWVRWMDRLQGKTRGATVALAWNVNKRMAIRVSNDFSRGERTGMELRSDSNIRNLSSARLDIYRRANVRTETESFTNTPVFPSRVRSVFPNRVR